MPLRLPKADILRGRGTFKSVLDRGARAWQGPIGVCYAPGAGVWRMGISIGRAVGTAVRRNRIKRLLRQAFRLSRPGWAGGGDLVVLVKPHEAMPQAQYVAAMDALVPRAVEKLRRKSEATLESPPELGQEPT
ncbi:MAG TPA: ribonuclease P protein component [Tepidisphaeraceae bacterium]